MKGKSVTAMLPTVAEEGMGPRNRQTGFQYLSDNMSKPLSFSLQTERTRESPKYHLGLRFCAFIKFNRLFLDDI